MHWSISHLSYQNHYKHIHCILQVFMLTYFAVVVNYGGERFITLKGDVTRDHSQVTR